MERVLEVKNISKEFDNFNLKNITFDLEKGNIMGLVGKNGSGKTTTIKLILGMLKRNSGYVNIFDKNIDENEIYIKQQIGVVFDTNYFIDDWSFKDVEKLFEIFYTNWNHDNFLKLVNKFNLQDRKVSELSKGMQMKLMLACALSYDAKLLILDEPTSGLDPVSRNELLEIITEYVRDKEHSVIFSTHITSDLEKVADSITFINEGNLVYTGSKNDLLQKYRVINGNLDELSLEMKNKLIGISKNLVVFEGLISIEDLDLFKEFSSRNASIDDIVIFISKGEQG